MAAFKDFDFKKNAEDLKRWGEGRDKLYPGSPPGEFNPLAVPDGVLVHFIGEGGKTLPYPRGADDPGHPERKQKQIEKQTQEHVKKQKALAKPVFKIALYLFLATIAFIFLVPFFSPGNERLTLVFLALLAALGMIGFLIVASVIRFKNLPVPETPKDEYKPETLFRASHAYHLVGQFLLAVLCFSIAFSFPEEAGIQLLFFGIGFIFFATLAIPFTRLQDAREHDRAVTAKSLKDIRFKNTGQYQTARNRYFKELDKRREARDAQRAARLPQTGLLDNDSNFARNFFMFVGKGIQDAQGGSEHEGYVSAMLCTADQRTKLIDTLLEKQNHPLHYEHLADIPHVRGGENIHLEFFITRYLHLLTPMEKQMLRAALHCYNRCLLQAWVCEKLVLAVAWGNGSATISGVHHQDIPEGSQFHGSGSPEGVVRTLLNNLQPADMQVATQTLYGLMDKLKQRFPNEPIVQETADKFNQNANWIS